jgi:hypothetical protein
MRYRTMTTMLVCAAILLVGLGTSPGAAAAPSPSLLEPHGIAVFEWHRLSQVNARVSDQRLAALSADGFKTVHADVGEYLEVADQPSSRTQQNRLGQLRSELRRLVARAARKAWRSTRSVAGPTGPTTPTATSAPSCSTWSPSTTGSSFPTSASRGPARHRAVRGGQLLGRRGSCAPAVPGDAGGDRDPLPGRPDPGAQRRSAAGLRHPLLVRREGPRCAAGAVR